MEAPTQAANDKVFDPKVALLDNFRAMSEWEKDKFMRFVTRILNNDPKAYRLAELQQEGKISRRQLLEAM